VETVVAGRDHNIVLMFFQVREVEWFLALQRRKGHQVQSLHADHTVILLSNIRLMGIYNLLLLAFYCLPGTHSLIGFRCLRCWGSFGNSCIYST